MLGLHLQHLGVHTHRAALGHSRRLPHIGVARRYHDNRLRVGRSPHVAAPDAHLRQDRKPQTRPRHRHPLRRKPYPLGHRARLPHAHALAYGCGMRTCHLLVDSHPAGRARSPRRQGLHGPEHRRRRIIHSADRRPAPRPRNRHSRRMARHVPHHRRRRDRGTVSSGRSAQKEPLGQ